MRAPSSRFVIPWLAVLAAATFFALMTPLGEGFDEPFHFAYIQYLAQTGRIPLGHSSRISREIESFLQNQPISWGLRRNSSTLLSHEEYWAHPNREKMDALFLSLRFSRRYDEGAAEISGQYESHQPPLYYLLMTPVFAIAAWVSSFSSAFFWVRLASLAVASLIAPGSFFLARAVLKDDRIAGSVAAIVVLFPGLYPDVFRISNDALTVPLACWTFVFLASYLKKPQPVYLYSLAALLVAGLWTKAFFIPILAAVVLTLVCFSEIRAAAIVLLSSIIGWPWYLYNVAHSGSLTGLPETIASHSSILSSIGALWTLDWKNVLNVLVSSHIWVGNWSFIGVRSWMYQVIFWLFLISLAGLAGRAARSNRGIVALVIGYLVFLGSLIYYATQVFQQTGTSVAEGWYLTTFLPVEAVLFVAGMRSLLGRLWTLPVSMMKLFLTALLAYTAAFVSLPYYAGITSHKPDGHLATYHPHLSDFSLMSSHLLRFHPWIPDWLPWLLLGVMIVFGLYSIVFVIATTGRFLEGEAPSLAGPTASAPSARRHRN